MSGPVARVLYEFWNRTDEVCMVKMTKSTCKRPAETYYIGENGNFYRCGKHTRILKNQCDNVEIRGCPLR